MTQENAFSTIIDAIETFDDLIGLDQSDTLTGTFKAKRRTNKKGISSVKATFKFKNDIAKELGLKTLKFKDKVTNSFFGDSENARTLASGNKKLDYFEDGKKIVEVSVEPEHLNAFETNKKLKGFFRLSLDDNFIAMSTGADDQFKDNQFLRADFENNLL